MAPTEEPQQLEAVPSAVILHVELTHEGVDARMGPESPKRLHEHVLHPQDLRALILHVLSQHGCLHQLDRLKSSSPTRAPELLHGLLRIGLALLSQRQHPVDLDGEVLNAWGMD